MNTTESNLTIDLSRAIGMAAAAKLMRGRGGRTPNVETVRRWANPKRGCRPRGADGPHIVLKTLRHCGDLLTFPEWVEEFERNRIAAGIREPRLPVQRSERAASASHRRAVESLRRQGVGGKP